LLKTAWTVEEDILLRELEGKHGHAWTKISRFITGRSENEVKNRWYSAGHRNTIAALKSGHTPTEIGKAKPINTKASLPQHGSSHAAVSVESATESPSPSPSSAGKHKEVAPSHSNPNTDLSEDDLISLECAELYLRTFDLAHQHSYTSYISVAEELRSLASRDIEAIRAEHEGFRPEAAAESFVSGINLLMSVAYSDEGTMEASMNKSNEINEDNLDENEPAREALTTTAGDGAESVSSTMENTQSVSSSDGFGREVTQYDEAMTGHGMGSMGLKRPAFEALVAPMAGYSEGDHAEYVRSLQTTTSSWGDLRGTKYSAEHSMHDPFSSTVPTENSECPSASDSSLLNLSATNSANNSDKE
jgi:hypothetical protein